MSAQCLKLIYEKQKSDLLQQVRYFTRKHMFPTSIKKQKVKPAMDVFRQEAVAAVKVNHELKVKGFEDIEGTVDFIE